MWRVEREKERKIERKENLRELRNMLRRKEVEEGKINAKKRDKKT